MLEYLLENHIYFFYYLDPVEINKLITIRKYFKTYLPDHIWSQVLLLNSKFNKIIERSNTINLITNTHHTTTIDKTINTRNKQFYQYLAIILKD